MKEQKRTLINADDWRILRNDPAYEVIEYDILNINHYYGGMNLYKFKDKYILAMFTEGYPENGVMATIISEEFKEALIKEHNNLKTID